MTGVQTCALPISISFNEIVVSAVIGAGAAADTGGVSGRKIGYTLVAWLGSLMAAGVLGYVVYTAGTVVV